MPPVSLLPRCFLSEDHLRHTLVHHLRSWQNQLFLAVVLDKLSLADVLLGLVRNPDLVFEGASLALFVGERARPVGAGVELALRLDMGKFAVGHLALSAVAARWHAGVSERAVGVGAVGEELAVHLALMRSLGGR